MTLATQIHSKFSGTKSHGLRQPLTYGPVIPMKTALAADQFYPSRFRCASPAFACLLFLLSCISRNVRPTWTSFHLIVLQLHILSIKLSPSMAKQCFSVQHRSALPLQEPCFYSAQHRSGTRTDEQIFPAVLLCAEHQASTGISQELLSS